MNKFFTIHDESIEYLNDFHIPGEWWSRRYEYKFAIDYLEKDDTILDAACGIEHPFKFYSASKVKKVIAIDKNECIKDLQNPFNNLKMYHGDITKTDYVENTFDKIFCISVLEHLQGEELHEVLKEFYRVLKQTGKLILTCDYPLLKPDALFAIAETKGFIAKEPLEYSHKDKDNIKGQYGGLRCYSMVLEKEATTNNADEIEKLKEDLTKIKNEDPKEEIKVEEKKEKQHKNKSMTKSKMKNKRQRQ
jgi:ubiquinone/menaquinone biosynthesis C-methylase UbiE